ncbi:MAG: glycosyltransferase, partial [Thermodesulfovibrio sp.]|nr:glycosyltransferase [Thermodesulfovibrio sp.]
LFVCITDFWVHPFWLYDEVDLYFLPSDYSLKFFDSTNYIVTGIPLRKGFWKEVDKERIRRKLDIRTDKLVVLMNLGANSILPMGDTIAYINKFRESLYFLIVVGKDKRRYNMLFDRLKRYKNLDFKLFSFVDDIHNLVFACDFCITKAGGVTVSELIYTKTPAIYYRSLPGQEEGNQEYIKESGLGLIAKKFEQLTSLTKLVIENPYILEFISNNLRNQRKGMDFFKIKDIVAEERLPDYESDFDLWYPGSGVLPV